MRKEHNELVRDRIRKMTRRDGRQCGTVRVSEAEWRGAVLAKVAEEALEAAEQGGAFEKRMQLLWMQSRPVAQQNVPSVPAPIARSWERLERQIGIGDHALSARARL